MKILVIGLGNPILGDDGVGWRVAEEVRRRLDAGHPLGLAPSTEVEVDCLSVGGLGLMERLVGCDGAILADAVITGQHPPGSLVCHPFEELASPQNSVLGVRLASAHDTTLANAILVGRAMRMPLPDQIQLVGIEIEPVFDFSEGLSPAVERALPEAVERTLSLIAEMGG